MMDVNKGWFNISEDSWEVYLNSKLRRLMELVRYAMQVGGGEGGGVCGWRRGGGVCGEDRERRLGRGVGGAVLWLE